MTKKHLALLTGGLISALAPAAMSACTYSLTTDAPTYNIGAGTATVKVYLTETLTDGSTSFADRLDQNGILATEFVVQRISGDAACIGAISRNIELFKDGYAKKADRTTWNATASPTFVRLSSNIDVEVDTTGVRFNGAPILLTTLTMALDSGTDTAQFSIDVPGPEGGYMVTYEAYALDASPLSQGLEADAFAGVGGTTFQVAVPEPAILGLAVASTIILIRRR